MLVQRSELNTTSLKRTLASFMKDHVLPDLLAAAHAIISITVSTFAQEHLQYLREVHELVTSVFRVHKKTFKLVHSHRRVISNSNEVTRPR
jgi:hypothetical protein